MHKKTLTRRDFLKLAGAASAGLALSACAAQATEIPAPGVTPAPSATPGATFTPPPTPRPQVNVLQPATLYAGPCNVGYASLAALSQGDPVTPLGTFGAFVRLEAQAGGTLYEGFVEKGLLDRLPFEVPALPVSAVPWLQKIAVPATYPLSFVSESPDYQGNALYGASLIPAADCRVEVELSVAFGKDSPAECSSGVWLYNQNSGARISLACERAGGWVLCCYRGETPAFCEPLPLPGKRSGRFILALAENNRILDVTLPDGQEARFDLDQGIFSPTDTIKVLTQIAPFSTLDIGYLSLSQLPNGLPETDPALTDSLGAWAQKHGLTFGTVTDDGEMSNRGERVLTAQANLLVWSLSWRMESERDGVDVLKSPPSFLAFAAAHNMRVRAHPLIGGPSDLVPAWLKSGRLTAQEIENVTRERIHSLMTRFTSVDEWVVVNEPLGGGAALDNNIWQRAFGKEYIDMAFRFAREANPGATLIFNEAEIDRPGARTKFVYDLLREAIERGTPVDGVGMQFHLKATHAPSKEEMLEAIQLLGSLGLGVYITELDVNLFGLRGSREEKWAQQAQIYRDVVEAALESGVCKSITTWGLSDRYSWLLAPEFQFLGGGEAPLPFDDDFHPKPAFFAVLDVLKHAA